MNQQPGNNEREARELFATALERFSEHGLAAMVRAGTDNSHGGRSALAAIQAALALRDEVYRAGGEKAERYAEWQQKRGMAMDTLDWAILEYDEYMKDDVYDAQAVLDRIIARLRERRDMLSLPPAQTEGAE